MITEKPSLFISKLPGPKGLPVLGNLLQINLQKLHSILEEWADNYGDIYQFKLFNKTVVAISEPALTQNILRDRPETFRRVSAIQADWMCFTADVTTNFAFGYDINLLEKKGDDSFQRHLEKFLPVFNRRANAPFPYWHLVKPPSERTMEQSLASIKETINSFVLHTKEKLEQQINSETEPANFLEALLLAKDEHGNGLTDAEIQGNLITILLAGEDTTAHTLAWLVYLITEYPEVQQKLQAEIDTVLGDNPIPNDISTLEKLLYTEAVMHETMRLKSVTPLLFIEPNRDVEIAGQSIAKGTFLMLLTRYGVLQEENFTEACRFIPERWLESKQPKCAHNRNASMPFGAGPRFCPGRNLAMLEMKMAVAMLCKNFSVTRVENGQPIHEVFSLQ